MSPMGEKGRTFGRYLGAVAAVCAAIAVGWVGTLMVSYPEDPGDVLHKVARFGALSAISVGTRVYDPAEPIQRPRAGYPAPDWQQTADAAAAFQTAHPGLAVTGVPEVPETPRTPFRFAPYDPAGAERLEDYFGLAAQDAVWRTRYRALAADDPWKAAYGKAMPDLYRLWEMNNFVNGLWAHGEIPDTIDADGFDVVRLAERARRDGTTSYCHAYALGLIQIARVFGYHGRLLSLLDDGRTPRHAVAELWVPDLDRWVLFDPDFNRFYGTVDDPWDAVRIRDDYLAGNRPPTVPGRDPATVDYAERRESLAAAYRNLEWHFRDDFWVNPYFPGHPARSDFNSVIWDDTRNSPVLHLKPRTGRREAVYFPVLNWAVVPRALADGTLETHLFASYPGILGVTLHGSGGEVQLAEADGALAASLPLARGENRFELVVEAGGGLTMRRRFTIAWNPEETHD